MSLDSDVSRVDFVGTGSVGIYPYPFKIFDAEDLQVITQDLDGEETILVYETDYTVSGVGLRTGGSIALLDGNLAVDHALTIRRIRPLKQTTSIKNNGEYFANVHENTFDKLIMIDQQHQEQLSRTIRLSPTTVGFNPTLPTVLEANRTIVVGPGGATLALGPTPAELAAAAGDAGAATAAALAAAADAAAALLAAQEAQAAADAAALTIRPGGLTGEVLKKASDADFDTEWGVGFDDSQYAYAGYSARFASNFSSSDLDDTLAKILNLQYAGPQISLSASGSGTIREKGEAVTAVTLSATTTKRSNTIAAVRFYKDGGLINTVASPNANGGVETYNWTGSFTDNTTFRAEVDDVSGGGGPTTVSSSANFTFVYPYFVGASAPGASTATIASMTKLKIVSTPTVNRTITASGGNVFYFAYPAAHGALTSILDVNGFEVIGSFTGTTANLTGLDGVAVSYRFYASNNPVVAGDYYFSFRR